MRSVIFLRLTVADVKMIVRNRQALFWALLFPLSFIVLFALIGSFRGSTTTIAVVDRADDALSRRLISGLRDAGGLEIEMRSDEAEARLEVEGGDLSHLLIIPERLEADANSSPPGYLTLVQGQTGMGGSPSDAIERSLDIMNLDLAGVPPRLGLKSENVRSDDAEFGAFVLPGILLWGIMSNSVIGIAVAMANYREKKILRRIKVSPLNPATFFAAQVTAYLLLSLVQAIMILGLGAMALRVSIAGNLLVIGILVVVCSIVFLNLGFIVGAFSKTGAAASGLGNLIVLPLVMLSGVFFPTDVLPGLLGEVVRFLPLAPMVDTLRGVTLGSKAVLDFPLELSLIAGWIVLTSAAAIKIFKFE